LQSSSNITLLLNTILLTWQVERNLHDAMNVARNVMLDPRLVPGGGAAEMALAHVSTLCYSLHLTCV